MSFEFFFECILFAVYFLDPVRSEKGKQRIGETG